MSFVRFIGIEWPDEATALLSVSVNDVLAFRDQLVAHNAAPNTINRRISSLSSFYEYLAAAAAEIRLPITVPNPAHAQFISRESTDARDETRALSATRARQLIGMPVGESVIDYRDRAILKTFLWSGIRLGTACRLKVSDFHQDGDEATLRLHEKGDKRRTIGLHFHAAQSISEYIAKAGLTSGPLFRPRRGPRSHQLADRQIEASAMYKPGFELPRAATGRSERGNMRRRVNRTAVRIHAALAACHHGHAAARCERRYHQGQRAARPPPRDHHANLRQAPAIDIRERQSPAGDLNNHRVSKRVLCATLHSARNVPSEFTVYLIDTAIAGR